MLRPRILAGMEERCSSCGREFRPDDSFCGNCATPRAGSGSQASAAAAPPPPEPSDGGGVVTKSPPVARIILMVAAFAVLPIVLITTLGDCGSAEGRMQVSGSPHGDWTFVPTGCASMAPYGRMGANLHADGHNDGAVYVVADPVHGPAVELEVPGSCRNADGTDCTVFPVPRDECQTFDVHVEPTGTVVNDVRLVEGYVHLDCTLSDGARVQGRIDFDGC